MNRTTVAYVPERGHLVWLHDDPQVGHEQSGRPALVLTPRDYNERTGLAVCCPITSRSKGYPFEIRVADEAGLPTVGYALADQVKGVDWRGRDAAFIGVSATLADLVAQVVAALLGA